MTYIIILVIITYLILIPVSIYFYIKNRSNKKLINKTIQKIDEVEAKLTKIQDIQNKLPDLSVEFDKLSVQLSSGFTELSSPMLNKFIEIKRDISQLNEFFDNKINETITALNEDKAQTEGLKENVLLLQQDIKTFSSYFSATNEIREKTNMLETQVNQLSNDINQTFKNEFLQIQQDVNSIKLDINGFKFDSLNIKNMDSNIFEMNKSIVKAQRDIMVLKEKLKNDEKDKFLELNETINPNDIIVDEDNIKEQVQTIIDYTVTPKIKPSSKKIIDMIDKGEIEIK